MVYAGAEDHRLFSVHIFQIGIHDQLIPFRDKQLAFQVLRIILDTVDAHVRQIDVGFDPDAADGHQHATFHCCFQIHLVRHILKQFQHILAIAAFRGRCQAKNELRVKICKDFLIGIRCRMVALVNNQVVKRCGRKLFQIFGNALDSCKNNGL